MKDGIITGTGNSRYLKGAGWPATYAEFKAMAEAGALPFDLNGINEAGWQQIGDALNKGNLLDDTTQKILELSDSEATVNNALRRIAVPTGNYVVLLTVKTPGGRAADGATVSGLSTLSGGACVTDSGGIVLGFSSSSTPTLTISSYQDASISADVTLIADAINEVSLQLVRVGNAQNTYTASQSIRFTSDVATINASAIGGGFSGTSGNASSNTGGSGGDSGRVVNVQNYAYTGETLTILVGAANGGNSSISGIITAGRYSSSGGKGGTSGGTGTAGLGVNTAFLFPSTSVGGAGGGAGGMYQSGASGGLPGGGRGGTSSGTPTAGTAGSTPGAGGGGGGFYSSGLAGGAGKDGLAGMTWTYKEDIA